MCTSTVRKFTKSTVMTRLKRLNRGDIPKYVTIVTQLMYLEIGKIVQYRIHTTLKECLLEYLKKVKKNQYFFYSFHTTQQAHYDFFSSKNPEKLLLFDLLEHCVLLRT